MRYCNVHRPSNIVNVRLRQRTPSIHLTLAEIFGSYSGLSSPLHLPLSQAHFILLVLLLLRYYSTSLVGLSAFHLFHCGQLDTVGPVDPSEPIYIYIYTIYIYTILLYIRRRCCLRSSGVWTRFRTCARLLWSSVSYSITNVNFSWMRPLSSLRPIDFLSLSWHLSYVLPSKSEH